LSTVLSPKAGAVPVESGTPDKRPLPYHAPPLFLDDSDYLETATFRPLYVPREVTP